MERNDDDDGDDDDGVSSVVFSVLCGVEIGKGSASAFGEEMVVRMDRSVMARKGQLYVCKGNAHAVLVWTLPEGKCLDEGVRDTCGFWVEV